MKYSIKVFLYVCMLFPFFVKAQLCSGTFGQPLIKQTFGQGNNTANWYGQLADYAPGASTFTQFIGPPGPTTLALRANQSGLVKTPATPGNPFGIYWQPHADHTGDENGLMFLIDGIATPTVFFEQKMDNLCPNTILRLSIWVLNTNAPSVVSQKPNMFLRVVDSNHNLLGEKATGDVPNDATWHEYSMEFSNNNSTSVTLLLVNNAPTNSGNDFALDDITVQACGPSISLLTNTNRSQLMMCEGETHDFTLTANISPEYVNPVYQWQEKMGDVWVDMTGQNTKQSSIDFLNRAFGVYQYRLITAIDGNIDRVNCRAISEPFTVTVSSKPTVVANNSGITCVGENVQLSVSQGVSYAWTGPNGFTSAAQNPKLTNVTIADAGFYEVRVTNASGCFNTSRTEIKLLPSITASTNFLTSIICENESISLVASGGSTYSWLPVEGLSDPNIPNPIASPKQTTTYTVSISNGTCSVTKDLTITVLKKASANAGEDKKILAGQSVTLNGRVTGNNVTYIWSPSDYLDDPTKLNPVATPPGDQIYKLNVTSNCNTVSDEVFIKAYPKVEIPAVFSPNDDGINDTWNIPSIANFPNPKLKVVNRHGQLVFENRKTQQWDGKFNGKNLPTGVYYYTLYLNQDFKVYSGWVLLTR